MGKPPPTRNPPAPKSQVSSRRYYRPDGNGGNTFVGEDRLSTVTEGSTRGGNGAVKDQGNGCTYVGTFERAPGEPHYHTDDQGKLTKCYHECKNMLQSYSFWIGMTIGFPIEHFAWGHIYTWLGIGH